MGTRGVFGFIRGGVEKVAYNHFDSYPDALGSHVLSFIKEYLSKLDEIYDNLELVDDDTVITEEHKKLCTKLDIWNSNVDIGDSWYAMLRGAQSEGIMYYGKGLKYMVDGHHFLTDSLFCEWAYIINLDTRELEFYKGFNTDHNADGRYASSVRAEGSDKYCGVSLCGILSLDHISDAEVVNIQSQDMVNITGIRYNDNESLLVLEEYE
jgi:hypothetical protein